MKKTSKLLFEITLVLTAIAACVGSYFVWSDQIRFVHVLSNSMAPTFHKGDILIVKSVPTTSLQVGQIPILPSSEGPGLYITHRIVSTESSNDITFVRTKGDANPIADDWNYSVTGKRVPVYIGQLPTAKIPFLPSNSVFLLILYSALIFLIASLIFGSPKKKVADPILEEAS